MLKMNNTNLIAISLFLVFISGCQSHLMIESEIEHSLVKDVQQLTRECDKKNVVGWLDELSELQHKLYEQAYAMSKDDFEQHFLGQKNNSEDVGDLYWPYMLYGAPYIGIQKRSMLSEMATACYQYLYNFEKSLVKLDYKIAEEDLDSWQSCIWTWFHQPQKAVNDFQACYQAIPKEKATKKDFVIFPVNRLTDTDEGIELPYVSKQKVELYLHSPIKLETVVISTIKDISEVFLPPLKWMSVKYDESRISKPDFDAHLFIILDAEIIFSTRDILYDYINFETVCTGENNTQQLVFSMSTGGTAMGNEIDRLYVYSDSDKHIINYKIIESQGFSDPCDIESIRGF